MRLVLLFLVCCSGHAQLLDRKLWVDGYASAGIDPLDAVFGLHGNSVRVGAQIGSRVRYQPGRQGGYAGVKFRMLSKGDHRFATMPGAGVSLIVLGPTRRKIHGIVDFGVYAHRSRLIGALGFEVVFPVGSGGLYFLSGASFELEDLLSTLLSVRGGLGRSF
jgi:hypothetical protein